MLLHIEENGRIKIIGVQHLTHHNNLESIMRNGLLSHDEVYRRNLLKEDISFKGVQQRRAQKTLSWDNKDFNLHEFVPFYFNAVNPMLLSKIWVQEELLLLVVNLELVKDKFIVYSNGNAASNNTRFYIGTDFDRLNIKQLSSQLSWLEDIHNPHITQEEMSRIMCAELLIYNSVDITAIQGIVCPNEKMKIFAEGIKNRIGNSVSHLNIMKDENFLYFIEKIDNHYYGE